MRKSRDNFNIAALFLLASSPFDKLGNLFPLIDFLCPEDFFGMRHHPTSPRSIPALLPISERKHHRPPSLISTLSLHQIEPTASTRF